MYDSAQGTKFKPMSLTDMDCKMKLTCANMDIRGCTAGMMHCNNCDPKVQTEHNEHSARFTCTNNREFKIHVYTYVRVTCNL